MYNRVFTFGCSFTKFEWPTWADIIAHDLNIESYNYGLSGIGNVGIAHRLLQADLRHNFKDTDLILIVWTGWTREDRYHNTWLAAGNVFNNPYYDKKFCKKHYHLSDCIIKNSHAIITSNRLIDINFQGHMNRFKTKYISNQTEQYLYNFYNPYINWNNIFEKPGIYSTYNFDNHPSINSHIEYVKQIIYPTLNFSLNQKTISKYIELHKKCMTAEGHGSKYREDSEKKGMIIRENIQKLWSPQHDIQ